MQNRTLIVVTSVFFIALLALPLAYTQDDAPTLEDTLADIPWLAVDHIETTDNDDGEAVLVVAYISSELDMVAYRAEMLEIFRVIGTQALDEVDHVELISMAEMGSGIQSIESATIDVETLSAYAVGEMTRTDFLEAAVIAPLEHGDGDNPQAPA